MSSGGQEEQEAEQEKTDTPWLAAYTRPRFEFKVKDYCEERGIEVFLPTYQSWRQWSDRRKLLRLPLFPSYVFLRDQGAPCRNVTRAPGFLWFVHNQSSVVRVAPSEVSALQRLLASDLEFDPMPAVRVGDEVEVVRGALKGCRGLLLRKGPVSVVLRISGIEGGVRVRLPDPSWVVAARLRPRDTVTVGHTTDFSCRPLAQLS